MPNIEKKTSTSSCDVIKVGVLACQGSFSEHVEALKSVSDIENGRRFVLEVTEVRLGTVQIIRDTFLALFCPPPVTFCI